MNQTSTSAAALAATHAAAFVVDRGWSEDEFAGLLDSKGVALIGDAACFALIRLVLDEAEVLTLATHPDVQRQGRAKRLLDAVRTHATQAGAATIFLEVAADNAAALALYQKAGFTQVAARRGYYARANQPNCDALILQAKVAG